MELEHDAREREPWVQPHSGLQQRSTSQGGFVRFQKRLEEAALKEQALDLENSALRSRLESTNRVIEASQRDKRDLQNLRHELQMLADKHQECRDLQAQLDAKVEETRRAKALLADKEERAETLMYQHEMLWESQKASRWLKRIGSKSDSIRDVLSADSSRRPRRVVRGKQAVSERLDSKIPGETENPPVKVQHIKTGVVNLPPSSPGLPPVKYANTDSDTIPLTSPPPPPADHDETSSDVSPLLPPEPSTSYPTDDQKHTMIRNRHYLDSNPLMESALISGQLSHVKCQLDSDFASMSQGDFAWIQELRDHGNSNDEIAQLLLDEYMDSPWIFLEPNLLPKEAIFIDHHQPFCVHIGGTTLKQGTYSESGLSDLGVDDDCASWFSNDEVLSNVQELCGLAGVIPSNRDLSSWLGSVRFDEVDDTLTASVSFQNNITHCHKLNATSLQAHTHQHVLLRTVRNCHEALENLCYGIGYAQRKGLCCDSFTLLYSASNETGQNVVELHRVRIAAVMKLRSELTLFTEDSFYSKFLRSKIRADFTRLKLLLPVAMLSDFVVRNLGDLFYFASLVVQLLCMAFSSYVKAHVGPIQPFFLDTPVHKIQLFGSREFDGWRPGLTASLCRFTCLDDMLQSPVIVFGDSVVEKDAHDVYDLLACAEDLVDTWGPGQFIASSIKTKEARKKLTAIMIGGGVIKPTYATSERNKVLHWSNKVDPRHDSPVRFTATEKIIISGVVEVNKTCRTNTGERWALFIASLENLGTSSGYWQFTEFQAGLTLIGQQFLGGQVQFNKTWTWHPGNSWKHQYLGLIADELPLSELDRPWGILVSACTGVATRVALRILLADVLPSFVGNLNSTPVSWTAEQPGLIAALKQGSSHVRKWYDELQNSSLSNYQELQTFSRRLIRHIFLVLRDTGIDREHKIFRIACPQGHIAGAPITMCLPVPCERASLWAQMLADTEHCATFACMTTRCLESQEHKCQNTGPWHCPSLDTAVQQFRAPKEAIAIQSQAWSLETNAMYWIGSPESGLQAKVVKLANSTALRLQISKSRIPQKTRARLAAMSRKRDRLRERQIDTWPAEDVLVLSQ